MTANTPQTRKAKGRRFQQQIRDLLLETFKKLDPDDVRSTSMGASGADLLTSPACQKLFPYAVECKCQEHLNIWAALKQAEKNSTKKLKPILFFKKSHSKKYVTLEAEEFMKLLKK